MIATRPVSRIGIASTSSGRTSVATVVSATFQLVASPSAPSVKPSTWLPESPMNTAAGLPGRKLNGRKPSVARPSESERTSSSRSSWTVTASIAKNVAAITASDPARPSMLSSRLKAFVIPTSQSTPMRRREHVVVDDLDREAHDEHDRGRAELRAELHDRGQRVDVVDQAGEEEERGAGEDAEQLLAAVRSRRPRSPRRSRRRARRRSRRRRRSGSRARSSARRSVVKRAGA